MGFLADLGVQPTNSWVASRYRAQGHVSRSRELRYMEAVGIGFEPRSKGGKGGKGGQGVSGFKWGQGGTWW